MQKKNEKKRIIILLLKIVLTVIYIAGLSFAIYKQVKNLDESHIVFLVLSILLFIFHIFAWISPKKLYSFCWKIYSIFPSEDIGEDYEIYLSKVNNIGLGLLIAAIVFLIIEMVFLF